MNIVLTGSLGRINSPLVQKLLDQGHALTIISSSEDRSTAIEALGAQAAIGSLEDVDFLTATFTGADAVYLMEPPPDFFNTHLDMEQYWLSLANGYRQAVENAGVKQVVHLSSIGGHTDEGVGMLAAHHKVENILKSLPATVAIKTMRPVGFYYNMYAYLGTIKAQDRIVQNYGGDEREPWVAPADIADAIAEAFNTPFSGRTLRYIASEELSPNEVAAILGDAIGKPNLKWVEITDAQMLDGMVGMGVKPEIAQGVVEMNAGRKSGALYEDYHQNPPVLGPTKLKEFAQEFAAVYNQS
jgi:uncharacterized protein YbjT (DUF2867 family)